MKIIVLAHPKDDHVTTICPGLEEEPESQKEKFMSSKNDTRVLNRRGARQLNEQDMEKVAGGDHITLLSAILTGAGNGQGHDVRSDT